MGGKSKTTNVTNVPPPTATELAFQEKQLELAEAQLEAIREQGDFQKELFGRIGGDLSPEEQAIQDKVNTLTLAELERAERLGPIEEELLQLQLDAIKDPGASPEELALIEEAIASSQAAGEAEIDRFSQDALEQVRDVLAPSRGFRPTDTPITDRGSEIAQEATRLKGDLTKSLAAVSANAKLNFPLAVSQFQSGAGNVTSQIAEAAQQFQQQLSSQAFLNRLNLLNTGGSLGLGLSSIGPNISATLAALSNQRLAGASNTTTQSRGLGFTELLTAGGSLAGGVGGLISAF